MDDSKVLSFPGNDLEKRLERVRTSEFWWLLSDDCPMKLCYCCLQKMDLSEFRDALAYALNLKERMQAQIPKLPGGGR